MQWRSAGAVARIMLFAGINAALGQHSDFEKNGRFGFAVLPSDLEYVQDKSSITDRINRARIELRTLRGANNIELNGRVSSEADLKSWLRDTSNVCSPELGVNLPFCTILDGINVTSALAAQTVDLAAKLSFNSMALTGEIASSTNCKTSFASFYCLQGMIGCNKSTPVSLLPCFQRCVDFQMSCYQMSSTDAASSCKRSVGVSNSARNENCFCGSNDPEAKSPYDTCIGKCHPLSECPPENSIVGATCTPETTRSVKFCAVLNGTRVISATSVLAADGAAAANFASMSARQEISGDNACRDSYAAYMCVQGVAGCNGSTAVSLMPCAQRCRDYLIACRRLSETAAAAACLLTANVTNTEDNSGCFCGRRSGETGAEVCAGRCDGTSPCGRSAGGQCSPVTATGFRVCSVLEGLPLSSQTVDVNAIDAAVSGAFNRSAAAGELANTADCRAKHAALLCPRAVYGCSDGAQTALRPCLTRCLDFQQTCLGKSAEGAAAACAATAGTGNTAGDSACFCGVDATVLGESGVCAGTCGPRSPCGQAVACASVVKVGLGFCAILNGITVRAGYDPAQLDADARALFNSKATGGAVNVARTDMCQARFADFVCTQGVTGCSNGNQVSLLPCLQRCLDFHTSCNAMSADRAAAECARSAGINNTASNADCFCGDPTRSDASPYDFCVGPCHPLSQCGRAVSCAPATVTSLGYCTVLNGMNVTSLSEARAAESATAANFASLLASGRVSNTAECRARYAALYCTQKVTGCSTSAAAAVAGLSAIRTSLLPCLQRCLDFQTSCLGAAPEAAAAACQLSAGVDNTALNADCFCGSGGGTTDSLAAAAAVAVSGVRDVCIGQCSSFSACGRAITCSAAPVSGLRYCTSLNGVTVANVTAAEAADVSVLAAFSAQASAGAVANTGACRESFALFNCWRGVAGCTEQTTGIGVETTLMPCLSRCIEYRQVCLGNSPTAAAAACTLTSWYDNTANNSDCFCGGQAAAATVVGSAAPSGFCVGACASSAGCGSGIVTAAAAAGPSPRWLALIAAALIAAALPAAGGGVRRVVVSRNS